MPGGVVLVAVEISLFFQSLEAAGFCSMRISSVLIFGNSVSTQHIEIMRGDKKTGLREARGLRSHLRALVGGLCRCSKDHAF